VTSTEANFSQGSQVASGHEWSLGTVAIVGVGLMGGSIGLALKANGRAKRIVGVGRNAERLHQAERLGILDESHTDLADGLQGADLVILCTTIGNIIDQIPAVLEASAPNAVITDIGSTKAAIVRAVGGDSRFVGGHPMCGSERTGAEAATATLYKGATWAVTPSTSTGPRAVEAVERLIGAVGALVLRLDPDVHDVMVGLTSHLPHVMASALMRQAADLRAEIPTLPRMSSGSFADMTRVAASPPSIWRDVCLTNREAVLKALQGFRAELRALEDAVAASDAAAIEAFFAAGESAKREWPSRRNGE